MKFVKICFVGGRGDAAGKFTIEVPDNILQLDAFPTELYFEDEEVVGDHISEDEWFELSDMFKTGKRFSCLVSLDEFDYVFGLDESDYGQMKQVMLDGWEDPEYYDDPEYGQRIMKTLDTLEWNDEMVDVLK